MSTVIGRATRDHDCDPRPQNAWEPADVKQPGGKHRAGVPRRHDRIGVPVTHRPRGANERGIGLGPYRLGRLVVHLDHAVGDDVRKTERIEPGRDRR